MAGTLQTVRKELLMASEPQRVFEAWASPNHIARWYVERAEGDPRTDRQIAWILGGEAEPLEVTQCEPDRRLVLTNVGPEPWRGAVVEIETQPHPSGTRASVAQYGLSEALREHLPNMDAGWECMLAILKEYVEHHWGQPRHDAQSTREFCPANTPPKSAPELGRISGALSSPEAIARWAGERPSRLLASTPRGAVVAFSGFPGLFVVMGVGAVSVAHIAWGDAPGDATAQANDLADRLLAHLTG